MTPLLIHSNLPDPSLTSTPIRWEQSESEVVRVSSELELCEGEVSGRMEPLFS